jgi:hypothetical protein
MVSSQQGSKGFAGAIGFFFGALLLSALVGAATAADQTSDGLLAQPSSDACTFACDTSGNTAGGNSVLQNNTGINNTGFGDSALSHNTTGTYDSAFGTNALFSNTTGFGNTASGAFALEANTSGIHDTAVDPKDGCQSPASAQRRGLPDRDDPQLFRPLGGQMKLGGRYLPHFRLRAKRETRRAPTSNDTAIKI